MIYGNPKQRLNSFGIDRDGAAKLSTSKPWSPSKSGLSIPELLAEIPGAIEIPGFSIVGRGTRLDNGVLRSDWDYEGMLGDTPNNPANAECTFEPEWGERSLLLHPDWFNLQKKYGGWVDQGTGRIIWPEWMPPEGYNTGNSTSSSTNWVANKMYGRQTYPDLVGGIWTFPYVTKGPIEKAYARCGDVFKQSEVPGGAPKFAGRDYMKMAPGLNRTGQIYHVQEKYKLSDVGGWMPEIHKNWSKK